MSTPRTAELADVVAAVALAELACEEQQPMPLDGCNPRLVAEACETIGEGHKRSRRWFDCAIAHRMACWYYRKVLDETR